MDTLLDETGKIAAETDSVFFGLSNNLLTTPNNNITISVGHHNNKNVNNIIDLTSNDAYLASDISDLDFDLLQDCLPEFNLLDDILMNDESSSNSFSSESYAQNSITDSPPLTPPSPSSSSTSSLSQFGLTEIKLEPASPLNGLLHIDASNNNYDHFTTNIPVTALTPTTIVKTSRGRSASQEAPEVQALKRHIRMIRNRESACLSRKKKKDYVTGVESRVKELEVENVQLKQENSILRSKLRELGHEIIIPSSIGVSPQKSTQAGGNSRGRGSKPNAKIPPAVVKIALLSLCCFLFVSFRSPTDENLHLPITNSTSASMSKIMINSDNLAPRFLSLTSSPELDNSDEKNVNPDISTVAKGKRTIGLWENIKFDAHFLDKHDNYTSKKNQTETNHRYLHISNRRASILNRSEDENVELAHEKQAYHNETLTNIENCGLLFNQTEVLRVQSRLKGIFGKRPGKARRKVPTAKPIVYSLIDLDRKANENKGLTVYDEKMRRYSKLFDQIERREDTYYVVSLAIENQLLFSAKAHNISTRPKMSFLMPWRNETHGGKEELMQIDCEVTGVFTLKKPDTK